MQTILFSNPHNAQYGGRFQIEKEWGKQFVADAFWCEEGDQFVIKGCGGKAVGSSMQQLFGILAY